MLSCHKMAKRVVCFWPRGAVHLYGVYRNFTNHTRPICASFCTFVESSVVADTLNVVESPELPNWIKFCEKEDPSVVESDDFVLPKIAEWADTQKLHVDHSKYVKHMVGEIVDSDVNRLAEVIKGQFESPNAVVCALAECGKIDLSESLVEKILQRFSNDWISAFGFFKWAKDLAAFMPTEKCYNMMVDILGMSRKFDVMWELIDEMHKLGGLLSVVTMSKVMRRLSKARKYDDAVETFKKFEHFGLIKDTTALNIIMDTLVKEKNVERAQEVFLEFKDEIALNCRTFNILIHGWCKARKHNEARKIMEEMEKYGCLPDVASYTCFVESYCQEKDFRKVDEILKEMQQKGCPPNVVTYTIYMLALGKAKEINESFELYHKMKQNGCVPDSSFYSALIFITSNSGRFKDACYLFNDMSKQNVTPDVLTYNTMISSACAHSKEEYAFELLKEMEEKDCRPNLKTFIPLLKLCCVKKRMKVLKYLLDYMFLKNISVDFSTYCLMVDRLCKSGKLEHACSFVELMILKGMVPKDSTYQLLMGKLEQKGMVKAKQQIESLMLKAEVSPTQLNEVLPVFQFGSLAMAKRPVPWDDQVDLVSSDDEAADMEEDGGSSDQNPTTDALNYQPADEKDSEGAMLRRARIYQEYMKKVPIPCQRGSVILCNSWMGLAKSIKELYGQPLHYLTNTLLKQWDRARFETGDDYQPLDTVIHPLKAEATIWFVEEVHRCTASYHHLSKLWLDDQMHHAYVDPIFPKI